MTAREIYETHIICPTPIEERNENTYNSIFESYQTREIQRHKNKAQIEGGSIYYPKAIEKLKYEISDKAPTLFHLWVNYGNLQDYFISESNINNILNWIDERLDERGEDEFLRKSAEENYEHELFTFVNNGALIIELKKLLNTALAEEASSKGQNISESITSKKIAIVSPILKDKSEEIKNLNDLFFAHNEAYKKHTAPFGYSIGEVLYRFIHEDNRSTKYIIVATKILYNTIFAESSHRNKRLVWKQKYHTLRSWQKEIASICGLQYKASTWITYSKPKVVKEIIDEVAQALFIERQWIEM